MDDISQYIPPWGLLGIYLTFSVLVFCAQEAKQKFNGSSQLAHTWLLLTGFGGLVFKYGCIVYYGFTYSWIHAVVLWVVGGLLLLFPGTTLLALITASNPGLIFVFGYTGFITLPVLGYFLINALP